MRAGFSFQRAFFGAAQCLRRFLCSCNTAACSGKKDAGGTRKDRWRMANAQAPMTNE